MLSFQRLDVYRRAIEFLALVYDIVGELVADHVAWVATGSLMLGCKRSLATHVHVE